MAIYISVSLDNPFGTICRSLISRLTCAMGIYDEFGQCNVRPQNAMPYAPKNSRRVLLNDNIAS